MNDSETKQNGNGGENAALDNAPRQRLRLRRQARDTFSTIVYVAVGILLVGEFFALFWLDLFY